MLQNMHEHIKGWIAGAIIAVISASFVLWGIQYYLSDGNGSSSTVAKVNGDKITENELNTAFQQLQREYAQKTKKALTPAESQQLKQYTLQSLILDSVLLNSAKKAGFQVSSNQVDELITGLPEFQENGVFSPERYQQLLYVNSLTSAQFMSRMANTLIMNQLRAGIMSTAFVLPNELKQGYRLLYQRRNFVYAIVPSSQFKSEVHATSEMINQYYQQHQASFKTPEKVSIEYILLSPSQAIQKARVSDTEIKQYYENNQSNFRVLVSGSAKTRPLSEVKAEIEKALMQQKVSALLAKQNDELSNLTYTNPTTLEPAARSLHVTVQTTPLFTQQGLTNGIAANQKVVAAAFSDLVLAQGNNSDPIELNDGSTVVIRVKEHVPSRIPPLSEVSQRIQQQLVQQLAQAKSAVLANQMQTEIQQGKSIQNVARENRVSVQTKSLVLRNDKNTPSPVLSAAFSLTLAKNGNVTTAVLPDGDTAVVQLIGIQFPDYSKANPKEIAQLQQSMRTQMGTLEYQLYATGARNRAKVKIISH